MNAIRTMAILGFCATLAGCAGSRNRTQTVVPSSITLAEARKGVEEGYALKRQAYLNKDVKALMALLTPDYHIITSSGEFRSRADVESYMARDFRGIVRWIHIDFSIDSLTLAPQADRVEADAIVRPHLIRMYAWSDKKLRHVDGWDTRRERWRWTPDGWKLAMADGFRDGCGFEDGKPDSTTLARARHGIEEGYRRNREAFLAKDVKAIMALRTEDFHTVGPDRTPKDRAAMETYTVGFLNGIDRWIEIEFVLDSLTLDPEKRPLEADVIMRQHLVRMALRPDQKAHHVETWATQNERWRWSPDGWRLAKVDNIRDQKRLADGKPE